MSSRVESKSYIKTVSKLQLVLLARLYKQALCGPASAAPGTTQTGQRRSSAVGSEEPANDKVANGRDQ